MKTQGGTWKKLVLAVAASAAACSDGPTVPEALIFGGVASLEPENGVHQSGAVGSFVAIEPAVIVRDAAGRPVAGAMVRFTVTAGGGTVAVASTLTDATGIARAGGWLLGPIAGENVLEAAVGPFAVRFTATAESPFTIEVRWVGTTTTRQKDAVSRAITRWRSVISSELGDIPLRVARDVCFEGQPALDEVVDDLLLFVEFGEIDGVNGVLGQAGPCFIRNENRLPLLGSLTLDAADILRAETLGTLDDIVLHEIGHVLGFGTIWQEMGLLNGARGSDPQFTGAQAVTAYQLMDGARVSVPVENSGSTGTRDGHWRDSVFGQELMTGYLSGAFNPLSSITIASLADLGYATHAGAADVYSIVRPGPAPLPTPGTSDLADHETLLYPRYGVDRSGARVPIPR